MAWLDPRSLAAAEYIVPATSLPEDEIPAAEVLAARRLRWQIELAFKRLKSLLNIGGIRTRTGAGTRCWLHAHLIVALLCDGLSQDILEIFPSGASRRGHDQFIMAHHQGRSGRHAGGDRASDHPGNAGKRLPAAAEVSRQSTKEKAKTTG